MAAYMTSFSGKDHLKDAQALRAIFRDAGYTDAGVLAALGVESSSSLRGSDTAVLLHRIEEETPLNTLIRLFSMELPVPAVLVSKATKPLTLETLSQWGLVTIDGETVTAAMKILPFQEFLIGFDPDSRIFSAPAPDYVMGIGSSSLTLANLTVRRKARLTLDLGCGCGVQALLASRHSDKVLAVDNNTRAVDITVFNARVNGLSRIESLEGDLFAPVEGKRFDLIVSNPPFVISPDRRFIYRDSGLEGDEIIRRIVKEAPSHLEEGGFCQILCNWAQQSDEDWSDRLLPWFEGSDCDVWIMRSETRDNETYASTWIRHTERLDGEAFARRFEDWMDYYRTQGIDSIGAGLITMRRATGRSNWFRADDGPEKMIGSCSDALQSIFDIEDFLRDNSSDTAILDTRFRLSPDVRLQQVCKPAEGDWEITENNLLLASGLAYSGGIDPYISTLISRCDGKKTLGELLTDMAASLHMDAADMAQPVVEVTKDLARHGFVTPQPH